MKAEEAVQLLAKHTGMPAGFIRSLILNEMDAILNHSRPELLAELLEILCKGEIPAPEEIITYIFAKIYRLI